ncbi:Cytochrome P450 [Mycena sanguinolenta]|uniref:Cytochrome P450 n=1 Tax=Mycena sanguinolenta TaxID=230812 RepID=A0A8H6XM04_9AGAR|nr:Cytochrome P450 [Mycena sanguinolenta]
MPLLASSEHPSTMDPPFPLLLIVGVGIVLSFLIHMFQRRRAPFPPGPPGIPFIGNLFQLPQEQPWLTYASWAKHYGDIVHLTAFGQHIILLNSESAVLDLLERRSAIYSDRPQLCMSGELVGWSGSVPMITYGDRHREYRKLLNEALASRKLEELHAIEEEKAFEFLQLLTRDSTSFSAHARRLVAAIILDISHGYTVAERDDPRMELAERANREFALSTVSGAYLCDILPFYTFRSGQACSLKKDAKQFKKTVDTLRNEPYDEVKAEIANGRAKPSFTQRLIERNLHPTPEEELTYKWAAVAIYVAGADTTTSALEWFFLAMSLYPKVQEKAHSELMKVVGPTRLPRFSDRTHLPYISALIKEIHRWNPVIPLALPHRLTQDDYYRGYHIPAGSIIWANSWSLLHDPAVYPAPFEFSPERFLSDNEKLNPDPRRYVFGYGRRSCPGQVLAEDMLYIAIVSTLSVFRIEPADASKLDVESTSTILRCDSVSFFPSQVDKVLYSHPKVLECNLIPRSEEALSLLQ